MEVVRSPGAKYLPHPAFCHERQAVRAGAVNEERQPGAGWRSVKRLLRDPSDAAAPCGQSHAIRPPASSC